MNRTRKAVPLIMALAICLTAGPTALGDPEEQTITEEVLKQITAAVPDTARVKPDKPRKILVFSNAYGHVHKAIPWAVKALELMGEKTGAYEPVFSKDPAVFDAENLKQFDAVCLNNTCGDYLGPPPKELAKMTEKQKTEVRKGEMRRLTNLAAFVKSGKGLVGIHSASDANHFWHEYGKLIGGFTTHHPLMYGHFRGEDDERRDTPAAIIKIEEPDHPLSAAFKDKPFEVRDEIYEFGVPYSRSRVRVLLSVDWKPTIEAWRAKKMQWIVNTRLTRRDHDFPVSWIHSYGKGRVFFCVLGHAQETFTKPRILQYFLDGIQFAAGDIEADTTPSNPLPRGPYKKPTLEEALKQLPNYSLAYSDNRTALSVIRAHVRDSNADPAARKELVTKMIALLNSDATFDAKQFACRQLSRLGSAEAVPTLATLLPDEKLSHMARYALERIPSPEALTAMRAALTEIRSPEAAKKIEDAVAAANGEKRAERLRTKLTENSIRMQVGLINSLGQRQDAQALKMLTELIQDNEEEIVAAAATALSRMGSGEATRAVVAARKKAKGSVALYTDVSDAYLRCAQSHLARGEQKEAVAIYKEIYDSKDHDAIRAAALTELVAAQKADALPVVVEALAGTNARVRSAALGTMQHLPGADATRALAGQLDKLPPSMRVRLIGALANRGDPAALLTVSAQLNQKDESVRTAAVRAMAALGNASTALVLARHASQSKDAERNATRMSLDRLDAKGANAALIAAMEGSNTKVRTEIIRALAARRARESIDSIFRSAKDKDADVRMASFNALRVLAEGRHLPTMVNLLRDVKQEKERQAVERATVTCMRRTDDVNRRADELAAGLKGSTPAARASILRVMGKSSGHSALQSIRTALEDDNDTIREAAVRALSDWPDDTVAEDLFQIASKSPNALHRILAFRGYVHVVGLNKTRPANETLAMYKRALDLAPKKEEKIRVLPALGRVATPEALQMVQAMLTDVTIREEAAAEVVRLANGIRGLYGIHVTDALMAARKASQSEDLHKEIDATLERVEKYAGHITAWQAAGLFTHETVGASNLESLLEVPQAPERPDAAQDVAWEVVPMRTHEAMPWAVDLSKIYRSRPELSRSCVAYIRTQVWSPKRQKATLELGNRWGTKVWLNGKIVHAHAVRRWKFDAGMDTTSVSLNEGWNTLLIKLIGSRWSNWPASARLTGPELEGLTAK